jgi:sugar lactone lactonase YvrE
MAEPNGSVTALTDSTPGFADGVFGKLKFPKSITLDPTGQTLYIADTGNSLIRKITTTFPYTLSTLAGNSTQFFNPFPSDNVGNRDGNGIHGENFLCFSEGITASPTGLYIADTGNNSIRALSFTGTLTTLAGQAGVEPSFESSPQGYTDGSPPSSLWNNPTSIFSYGSSLYITEPSNTAVRVITNIQYIYLTQ